MLQLMRERLLVHISTNVYSKKFAHGFNTAAQDLNPGPLSRESEALPLIELLCSTCSARCFVSMTSRCFLDFIPAYYIIIKLIIHTVFTVKSRITFKTLLLTFKCLHGLAPPYLSAPLSPYCPIRRLHSSD